LKVVGVDISDLDTSCWSIQFWGREICTDCIYNGTKDCGGNVGNAKLIKEGKLKLKARTLK